MPLLFALVVPPGVLHSYVCDVDTTIIVGHLVSTLASLHRINHMFISRDANHGLAGWPWTIVKALWLTLSMPSHWTLIVLMHSANALLQSALLLGGAVTN